MTTKILLVTSHPLSDDDARRLVAQCGADGTQYVIAVPGKVVDSGVPSLLSGTGDTGTHTDPSLRAVVENLPGTQGGRPLDPGQHDYGQRAAIEAEAIAGSAADALVALGAGARGHSVPDHELAQRVCDLAVEEQVDEIVVMTGTAAGLGHLLGTDLTSRLERRLRAAGSPIPAVREHRHV